MVKIINYLFFKLTFFGSQSYATEKIHEVEKSTSNVIVCALPVILLFAALDFIVFYFLERKDHNKNEIDQPINVIIPCRQVKNKSSNFSSSYSNTLAKKIIV
jgi:hypothetical protein